MPTTYNTLRSTDSVGAEYNENGYVGSWLCSEDNYFTPTPLITINFSKSYPDVIPGLTIVWSSAFNEWATQFRVIAWHSGNEIFNQYVRNDSATCIMTGDIRGFDKITIEIVAWSKPFRRARMESLFLGIEKIYSKPDIMSYSATYSVDPLSASLPKSEITFELENTQNQFNPDNPSGIYKYLMERQRVSTKMGYKLKNPNTGLDEIEWIPGGVFYLSEWNAPQNGITASFTARDVLEFMSDTYNGVKQGTLEEIAIAALEQANLPELDSGGEKWELDRSLSQASIPDDLDFKDYSIAEVLQYVANAACCVLYQDRLGKFYMHPMGTSISDIEINRFNSYSNAEISLLKPLRAIDVNKGQYYMTVGLSGETQQIDNPFIDEFEAPLVARWVANYLVNRKGLDGECRIDCRMSPMDIITIENQFSRSIALVTEVKISYNGAYRGSYSARQLQNLSGSWPYSGMIQSNQEWYFGIV